MPKVQFPRRRETDADATQRALEITESNKEQGYEEQGRLLNKDGKIVSRYDRKLNFLFGKIKKG